MSETGTPASVAVEPGMLSMLPGVEIVARIRRIATTGALALVGYATFTRGSAGVCAGRETADGGYLDAAGNPTDTAPQCLSLTLGPSPAVIIAVVLTFFIALTLVMRRAQSIPAAVRILDRAAIVMVAIAAVSLVVSLVWFGLIVISDWTPDRGYAFFYPFPFGSVEMSVTPMSASVTG